MQLLKLLWSQKKEHGGCLNGEGMVKTHHLSKLICKTKKGTGRVIPRVGARLFCGIGKGKKHIAGESRRWALGGKKEGWIEQVAYSRHDVGRKEFCSKVICVEKGVVT